MTHTPMDEAKEDKTSEVDLIDPEQEEECTVVIPSLPTIQEITRYVYDSPYDRLVPDPDTGISVELCHSMTSQFLVNHCKLPTMFCMIFGYPNLHNILDQSPFCNAKQQLNSKCKVVNENMKTEIHQRSYFLLKEIPHDDNHPLKNGLVSRFSKHANGKRNDLLKFLQTKSLNTEDQLMDSLFVKWWMRRFKAYVVEHIALEDNTKVQSTQTIWSAKCWAQGLVPNL